jgi:PAS domain S-box-containing protein
MSGAGRGFPAGGVFRAALDAVIVIDADGTVRDWNQSAERLFGYTWQEAIGRELAALVIPGPLRSAHRNGLGRYLATGESTILDRRVEVSGLRKDGSEVAIELSITRVPDTDPPLFAGFVRAKSDREHTEYENLRLQQRMAFLAQAWIALDRSLDYRQTLEQLAALTVPELAQLTVIDLLDEEGMIRTPVRSSSR